MAPGVRSPPPLPNGPANGRPREGIPRRGDVGRGRPVTTTKRPTRVLAGPPNKEDRRSGNHDKPLHGRGHDSGGGYHQKHRLIMLIEVCRKVFNFNVNIYVKI